MSEHLQFQLSRPIVLRAIEEHVNRALFKGPIVLTNMQVVENGDAFMFMAEISNGDPRVSKPRKAGKRGLAKPVLEPQVREANGAEVQP